MKLPAQFPSPILLRLGVVFMVCSLLIPICRHAEAKPGKQATAQRVIVEFQYSSWFKRDFTAYTRRGKIYVPIIKLFSQLSVKISYNSVTDQLKGFFISPANTYSIDLKSRTANRGATRIQFEKNGFITQNNDIYLQLELLNRLFKLGLSYESRNMRVRMNNSFNFPYIQRQKRQRMRTNRLTMQRRQDSLSLYAPVVSAYLPFFRPGITNWKVRNSFYEHQQFHSVRLNHMGFIAGGDYSLYARGTFPKVKNIYIDGRWRWVDPAPPFIRQIQIGSTISNPYNPARQYQMNGIYMSNYKPIRNGTFAHYRMSTKIRRNREVALYHNRRLVDYKLLNQPERISFKIPLGYGSHSLAFKYFGPHGEYREVNRYINIPASLIPAEQWRYELAVGSPGSSYKNANTGNGGIRWSVGYGITDDITLKTGGAYTRKQLSGNSYLNLLWNFRKRHYINGFISSSGEAGGSWRYSIPGNWRFRMRYEKRETMGRIRFYGRSEFQHSWLSEMSKSWQWGVISGYTYLSNRINSRLGRGWGNLRLGISMQWKNIRGRIEPGWKYRLVNHLPEQVTSLTRVSIRFPIFNNLRMRFQSEWNESINGLSDMGVRLHKRLNRFWQISIGGTMHEKTRWSGSASVRLNLPFGKSQSRMQVTNSRWSIQQRTSGSVWYNHDKDRFNTAQTSWNQRGKVVFKPYLDVNSDGMKNMGDRWMDTDFIEIASDRQHVIHKTHKAGRLYVPYQLHTFELNTSPFSHMRVTDKFKVLQISPYPNLINYIAVPLRQRSTASGRVSSSSINIKSNLPDSWQVAFTNDETGKIDTLQTLPSGRFYHQSIKNGVYSIQIVEKQLKRYNVRAIPRQYEIAVGPRPNKRHVRNLIFSIKARAMKSPVDQGSIIPLKN